ncbi:MAG: hypothetical protein ACKVZ0_12485 [Gemmatimonadales bacterium]
MAFEVISGRVLPVPDGGDSGAMLVWSGVGFLRVLGAALAVLGSVTAAYDPAAATPSLVGRVLAVTAGFATVVTAAQVQAIWGVGPGLLLVFVFGVLTAAGARIGWAGHPSRSAA